MVKEIFTEIMIDAPVDKIWEILMNFKEYSEWNPWITSINGGKSVGEGLIADLGQPNGKIFTIKPKITEFEEATKFAWLGHMGVKGLFDGNHIFELVPLGENKTKLIHKEKFSGILKGIILKFVKETTRNGFIDMNIALKERAEIS